MFYLFFFDFNFRVLACHSAVSRPLHCQTQALLTPIQQHKVQISSLRLASGDGIRNAMAWVTAQLPLMDENSSGFNS